MKSSSVSGAVGTAHPSGNFPGEPGVGSSGGGNYGVSEYKESKCCSAPVKWVETYPKCSKCGDTFFPTDPTVEKWENIDGLMKEVDSQLVRTPAGNVSVIDEMIPCDVMARVKYFLYKAYDLGKARSVQEAEKRGYWRACKDKDEAIRLSNEEIEPRIKKLVQEARAEGAVEAIRNILAGQHGTVIWNNRGQWRRGVGDWGSSYGEDFVDAQMEDIEKLAVLTKDVK